jgi:hypothetical protein
MRQNLLLGGSVVLILPLCILWGHQPRIVSADTVIVRKPEISQAFYGQLAGKLVTFLIETPNPLELHAALMAPMHPREPPPHLFLDVAAADSALFRLEANPENWASFHEFFTWDNYHQGPRRTVQVPPGKYTLTLNGEQSTERYVLVVGKQERWPPGEILNTLALLPRMKRDFFGKSPWVAYFNPFSAMLFGGTALLVGLVYLVIK